MTHTTPEPANTGMQPDRIEEIDEAIAAVEREFGIMFNRVRQNIRQRAARIHPDLQPVGFNVISALVRDGPHQTGRLAEVLMADKSVISRTVKQLEELGLVSREQDPADGRAHFIVATDDGRDRFEAVIAAEKELLYERMRDWPASDVNRLADLLVKLNETFLSRATTPRGRPHSGE
ncbi:MarR family winged helix-turn-helix transcriptional regulator [Okibacterium endophyticum]